MEERASANGGPPGAAVSSWARLRPRSMRPLARAGLVFPLALALAGCLPSSQRANTRALTPADSLSMRLAEGARVDTLRLMWTAGAPEASPLELPTSMAWLPDSLGGELVIADTRRGSLHAFSAEGAYVGERRPEGLRYPYLAGTRGDTVVVYSRGERRLDFVVGERVARRLPLPVDYAAVLAADDALWAKRAEEGDA